MHPYESINRQNDNKIKPFKGNEKETKKND